ncbi:MAG: AbrB/MazE/SpoVT family DNA-binding domain-containing protein [Nanoarchaeota archaeon]|nr:AbrB/MazE/SpoVT family DNA-binding domain-containing protein [Nanoarchaeota archaeon]
MARLTINKNGQATITIPKDVIEATGWKNGTNLYIGKNKGENTLFIERNGDNKK